MIDAGYQLFEKRGRRYIPWGNGVTHQWDYDEMPIGQFRLIHCPAPGHYRMTTAVTPDRAAFLAAAMEAEHEMIEVMQAAAMARFEERTRSTPLTPEQLAIIERFRIEMATTGALLPTWWTTASAADIARAGIDAVRRRVEP
jgi:putative alpha-1,2-mannosidase